jgi:hypothetical protein
MKAPLKKKPSTNSSPKKPKRTSKKTPKKNPVATPKQSYSKIEEIWAAAPDDETRDNWIYDKLGISLADRTSPEDLHQTFQAFLYKLVHLIQAGRLSEASQISHASVHMLVGLLEFMEESVAQFKEYNLVKRLLKEFANEWNKRKSVPDRKAASQKAFYNKSCENHLLEVIILHRAGWRRHWNSPTDLPSHPFGSTEGANNWRSWSMNFLKAIHEAGLIKANPDSKAAKGQEVRGRLHVHKQVFKNLNELHPTQRKIILDIRLDFLNAKIEQESKGKFKTFLQKSALEHPDYAPMSSLKELVETIKTNHQKIPPACPPTA